MTSRTWLVITAAIALALASCGDKGDGSQDTETDDGVTEPDTTDMTDTGDPPEDPVEEDSVSDPVEDDPGMDPVEDDPGADPDDEDATGDPDGDTIDDVTTDDVTVEDVTSEDVTVEDVTVEDVTVEDVTGEEVTTSPILFFSEYVEGSSDNKAVEIYNGDSAAYDLGLCRVSIYFNGASTSTANITLTSTSLAVDAVYVLCHSSASFTTSCDQTAGNVDFNGNDAVELACDGTTLDVIGQIGFNPGAQWGTGLVSTANNTIRRQCSVTSGDPDGSDVFDPSTEWDGYATDTFGDLGSHCP